MEKDILENTDLFDKVNLEMCHNIKNDGGNICQTRGHGTVYMT
jgi:hypothetical protein